MRLNEPIDSIEGLLAEDEFHQRHLGPDAAEQQVMLAALGLSSLDALIDQTVPESIRLRRPLNLPAPTTEQQALKGLKALAEKNKVYRSYIGAGYYGCITPEPIKRSLLENPGWYTAYTPYQAEVAQGRLEALMNFQQLVIDLTGLPMANASLLDEATAAAEAMGMFLRLRKDANANVYLVDKSVHPQVLAVIQSRAQWMERPDRLVELFKATMPYRTDLRLLMVGNGVMESQLKNMAAECAAIQFLPFQNQNQIPVIYRVGDISVLPSEYNETWGLALNESMASGRTVMATAKCGATVDLIKPGITGFIFPDTNIHTSLQTHMLRDLPNREELLEMGAVCQTFISTNWTYDVVVSAIQKLLMRLSKDPQP